MKKLDLTLYFAITFSCLCLTSNNQAIAQIIPDTTLPSNSIAIPNGNSIRIEGGTTNGSTLFHSFQEFSVPTGSEAFFNNTIDIQNIFSRVTGSNISNIDGLIRANGVANLFLINPNGIIFGRNAQLNIGGSFIDSTASSIRFADGTEFSATNPNAPSLLTINVPIGLQFEAKNGSIVNRSQATAPINLPPLPVPLPFDNKVGLAVAPGQTLALVGGDIQLDAGNLTASTGQILLGSVASPGLVSFTATPFGLNLNYDNISNFGNIEISNGSVINTSGIGGGKIDIRGGNVTLSGGRIYAMTLGSIDGRGININAQQLRANTGAQIFTLTVAEGAGGDINIRGSDSVELSGIGTATYQSFIGNFLTSETVNPFDLQNLLVSSTVGSGASGNITIDTARLLIDNGAIAGSPTFSSGNAGNMTVRAKVFEMVNSGINNGTLQGSTGLGGKFTFEGERLILRDAAGILTITLGEGASGNIEIKASESVELLRTADGSFVETSISTSSNGFGKAGDIIIDTKRLAVSDGAGISSTNGIILGNQLLIGNQGQAGNLSVRASESVEIAGVSGLNAYGSRTGAYLTTETFLSSRGGDIYIWTPLLTLRDTGIITTGSFGQGDAGNITIDASRVELLGTKNVDLFNAIQATAGLAAGLTNPNATGNAGSVNLNVNELIVENGAGISVASLGRGSAGNINAIANSIVLDNRGNINGTTRSGAGANINLQARNFQLRRNSRIATDAGESTGGNIAIDTNTLVALENSDITANAQKGSGGRVSITAQGIFGTQFRNGLTPQSDITATSELGPEFSGVVEINTPDVDPSSGLVELSPHLTDVSDRIASACPASGGNSFTVVGRGGLPADPSQILLGRAIWRDVRSLENGESGMGNRVVSETNSAPGAIEATGWQKNQKGEVELVANASGIGAGNPWYRVANCGG